MSMVGRVTRRKQLGRKNIPLPHELVMEILSRLPAKYLWPLRCVSKSWLQLITLDPHFAQLHLDHTSLINPNPGILSVREGVLLSIATDYTACDKAIQLELPFHPNYYIPGVICNGLLLVCSLIHKEVYIWNPLTNDYITIPDNTLRCPILTTYGFGFDKLRNEYKVMRVLYNYTDFYSQVSLYTLGVDSSWRRTIEEHNLCNVVPDGTCIPHINGFLYWLTWKQGVLEHILAFDLKDEGFQEILPPNALNLNKQKRMRMGELGGLLCLFVECTRLEIDIWTMKEHGVVTSWTKQFRIERPNGCRHGFSLGILGLVRGGRIILKKCNNRNHLLNELSLYDPKTNSVRTLKRFQKPLQRVYAFIGSIISPSAINGARKSLTKGQT